MNAKGSKHPLPRISYNGCGIAASYPLCPHPSNSSVDIQIHLPNVCDVHPAPSHLTTHPPIYISTYLGLGSVPHLYKGLGLTTWEEQPIRGLIGK